MQTHGLSARFLRVVVALVAFPILGRAQMKNVAERLGYPADSKLLIIHADDLACGALGGSCELPGARRKGGQLREHHGALPVADGSRRLRARASGRGSGSSFDAHERVEDLQVGTGRVRGTRFRACSIRTDISGRTCARRAARQARGSRARNPRASRARTGHGDSSHASRHAHGDTCGAAGLLRRAHQGRARISSAVSRRARLRHARQNAFHALRPGTSSSIRW